MTATGHLQGLTSRGWFHINWLHLNRSPLVALRQQMQMITALQEAYQQAEQERLALQERIRLLEGELVQLQEMIARLTSN